MEINVNIDIEATNRCNAVCHFCPRDATPHQGHMSMETFEQALLRAVELREQNRQRHDFPVRLEPNVCGLGEPLINPHTPEFIRRIREAGFDNCSMASNGALLDERRGDAILEAGVTRINVNISDLGKDYEDIYNLPFETTRDNIIRFVEKSRGHTEVHIVLVNHRCDPEHTAKMEAYWNGHGVDGFMKYDVINRGGALFVDHMQYEQFAERQQAKELMSKCGSDWVCPVPYLYVFIGYDGLYYLCCSDWKKEAPMASVFDTSILSISEQKLHHLTSREPVCKTCNHDPLNSVTDMIRAVNAGEKSQGELDEMVNTFTQESASAISSVSEASRYVEQVRTSHLEQNGKRLIPVVAV
ncbi:MAG: radical SAM/SPASM domain-containing protein [Pseudomonadota bacterium]